MDGLAEGDVLADRYRLGPAVGHGAMGEVHLAEDLRLARPVAIKSLRSELARYPDVRLRFGHEARAAARISHPNVVRIYDTGEEGRIPYLVMECLPGTSLLDELAWGTLEPRRVRRVALDVLGALDAAHRLGVVHRDVKPGNILLTATIDGPVKVSDFGIAKSADDHSITDSGALVGTPAYLAPERVAGEPAGPASDLYSLGVVLFEALTGRRPYEGETSLALALAIHMGEGPNLHDLRPDLDPALVAIIDRALARDPADRWPSAATMSEALWSWRPPVDGRRRAAVEGGGAVAGPAAVAAEGTRVTPEPTVPTARPEGSAPDPGATVVAPGRDDTVLDRSVPGRTVPLSAAELARRGRGAGRTGVGRAAPAGAADLQLDDGSTASRRERRRRLGLVGAGVAGLLLMGVVAVSALRGSGDDAADPPPSTAQPVVQTTQPPRTTLPPPSPPPPPTTSATVRAPARPRTTRAPRTTRRATTVTTARPTTTAPPSTPATTAPPTTPATPTTVGAAVTAP